MEDQLSILYRQIQEGMLDDQQAAELLRGLLTESRESEPNLNHTLEQQKEEDKEEARARAIRYFKKILSSGLMLPERQIEEDAPLEKYGIDSVMVMKLTDELERQFGPLSKTLFYEYQNIAELTEYFMSKHQDRLQQLTKASIQNKDLRSHAPELKPNTIPKASSTSKSSFITGTSVARSRRQHRGAGKTNGEAVHEKPYTKNALDIAIVGMAGRYPQSDNLQQFWENLKEGRDCITEIPEDRWDYRIHAEMHANRGKRSGKWGGFIHGVDRFDPLFFQISPKEAERIDPQERLFLECVYETLQDAGYTRELAAGPDSTSNQKGNVGVFVGVMYQEYQLFGAEARIAGEEPFALNGNPASIANRVSYFCDFHGPSMVVDTMCSSSLTAIHLACQSLAKGECRTAIAGGVNVSVHPNKYVMLTQGQFLSSKGRCESFGEGGDGYVPGEGVGAVMLKPLSRAIADGDHIYGVIKGTAVNHGGKTNGYTVPNPARQAKVIESAVAEAGIQISDISYIEAHGTGTSLGDPIEISGLTQAFQKGIASERKCAIGSAKSNIGHCESAAGIAGLTKVLLQMQHRQLVPSIHADPPNPHIQFEETPFAVQKQLEDWDRMTEYSGGSIREVPRIAGISSFGAGGSNAHIIVEEYDSTREEELLPIHANSNSAEPEVLVVLSARNEQQLRESCERMVSALRSNRYKEGQLGDIAYTLQTGREMMDMRLGIVAGSLQELILKLENYCSGEKDSNDIYVGHVGDTMQPLSVLSADADMKHTLMNWIAKRKFGKLLEFWVSGLNVDWSLLHSGCQRNKISLPTYPFAKERYWVPEQVTHALSELNRASSQSGMSGLIPIIHPLLHENKSSLSEQKYATTLTGQEFYLRDHRIGQDSVLPGAVYLEMACAAIRNALGEERGMNVPLSLTNHVWVRPLGVKESPVSLEIRLHVPDKEQRIHYEIFSKLSESGQSEDVVHSSGYASILPLGPAYEEGLARDLKELEARCRNKRFTGEQCYQIYDHGGLRYGPAHQVLTELHVGEGEVVGKIRLPAALKQEMQNYVLHPAMLDGALQSAIGLWIADNGPEHANPMLPIPYAIDEILILDYCTEDMWAHVRFSSGASSLSPGSIPKLDIDLFNSDGRPSSLIQGLSCRAMDNHAVLASGQQGIETALLVRSWEDTAVDRNQASHRYDKHIVMLAEPFSVLAEQLQETLNRMQVQAEVVSLASGKVGNLHAEGAMPNHFAASSIRVLEQLQQVIGRKSDEEKTLIQVLWSRDSRFLLYGGLTGMLRTAALENPRIHVQFIEKSEDSDDDGGYDGWPQKRIDANRVSEIIMSNRSSQDIHIGYKAERRQVLHWKSTQLNAGTDTLPWKDDGVYLITGGAGGLGHIFAREIAAQAANATLILTGRSEMPANRKQEWEQWTTNGVTVVYHQADISRQEETADLVFSIQQTYGHLNGIIHSAGLMRDNYTLHKTQAELEHVLAPKVAGTVHLDEATREMNLDFFILFSSLSGVYGNPGQCDYATANAFMSSYAHYRHRLMLAGEREGKTLAINWPLWKEGGMHMSALEEKELWKKTGMRPLSPEEGITMLYRAFQSGECEITGIQGDIPKLVASLETRWTMNRGTPRFGERNSLDTQNVQSDYSARVPDPSALTVLQELAADLLWVEPKEISRDAEWLEYGLDQPQLTLMAQKLNERYGMNQSYVLFVEYPTLQSASVFLTQHYPDVFQSQSLPLIPISSHMAYRPETSKLSDQNNERVQTTAADNTWVEALDIFLKKALSSVLKVPVEQMESHAPLENYGIDSISISQLTDQLEATFGPLSKTLLFEYQTVKELRGYFIKSHRDTVVSLFTVPSLNRGEPSGKTVEAPMHRPESRTFQRIDQRFLSPTPVEHFSRPKDIAVIGLSGRYPGADNLDQFWENLIQGKDSVTEIPSDRWDYRLHSHHADEKSLKARSKWGGFIQGVDRFDPLFFHISPREAQMMDPQERLFLETAYEAIEDAGYTPQGLGSATGDAWGNRVGVYVGVMYEEYQLYAAQAQAKGDSSFALSGNPASIANRVSYYCNFNGPSMAVDTMCSSSLTAIHLACQSLALNECEVAVAGGVNVSLHPNKYILLNQGGFLSSEGRCKSFGAQGDGYVPSEGVGAVILKPLKKAMEDGDHIYGVIKGTALNHGGKTNGYTVPNPAAQACVIGRAIAESDIPADTITYVEAHGTGTSLGDPIEVAGLSKAFAEYTDQRQFCALGSVKSNIGHAESAAGIAGLTKILLQMKHEQLVPTLHSEPGNPHIDFVQSPFRVQRETAAWEQIQRMEKGSLKKVPRRAGLSSFGAGGSNAHLIIEAPESSLGHEKTSNRILEGPVMIVLSARTASALKEQTRRMLTFLDAQLTAAEAGSDSQSLLEQIAFTLQTGRQDMGERLGFVAHSLEELKERLEHFLESEDGNREEIYQGNIKTYQAVQSAIAMDEDFGEVVQGWLKAGKYGKVLELWVKGVTIDWKVLYSKGHPCRISLPAYPFERERCWFVMSDEPSVGAGTVPLYTQMSYAEQNIAMHNRVQEKDVHAAGTELGKAAPERHMTAYHKDWLPANIEATISDAEGPEGTILILSNHASANLAARLSEQFKHSVVLNEEQLDSANHWLKENQKENGRLTGMIDLTACRTQTSVTDLCQEQVLPSWLKLMQEMIENHGSDGMLLLMVTCGLEAFRNSKVNLTHASRAGLYRMLQSEYRSIRSRHLDVDPTASDEMITSCITEEFRQSDREPEVCYRDGKRWRSYMREIRPEFGMDNNSYKHSMNSGNPGQLTLDENQVLWITGGTRGLGMACARHFVEHHHVKKLVLSGREAIPPREEWDLHADRETPLGSKIRSLLELEKRGARVLVVHTALTDESAIQAELGRVRETWGPIGGVIHCAGSVDDVNPAFIRKQAKSMQKVLDPKTHGVHVLYRAFRHEPLRFFVMYSSVSSALPSLAAGQSDYAMANAYLDYFAEAARLENTISPYPVISIQWPSWEESGFGAVASDAYRQSGLLNITDAEGLFWLDRIIREDIGPVILPAVVEEHSLLNQENNAAESLFKQAERPSIPLSGQPAEKLHANALDALENETLKWLKALMAAELRLDESRLDEDTPFQHYGMDSILLVQVLAVMDHQLQHAAVDPSLLLEYPTLRQLAHHLARIYPERLGEMLAVPEPTLTPIMLTPTDEEQEHSAARAGKRDKIAIIGVACHFPHAVNPAEFWSNLQSGRDSMTEITDKRLELTGSSRSSGKSASKKRIGAFIQDIEQFDPEFFRISDTLAAQLDPLQRQLLEVSVEAAEDAGYSRERLWDSQTGVFVGSRTSNFSSKLQDSTKDTIVGIGQNFIAAHLSHFYNLKGPNMVVDTACSSSLTAVHLAVRSLLDGECDLAFAGGVDILLDDAPYEMLGAASVLSPDYRCKTFSADADGIGLGEGCGVVMLKPLSRAIADQDNIYGVIDGTAINNDGQTMGITTPNPEAQQALLEKAISNAGVHPASISYIETHGTGTLIGDPIELKALTGVFAKYTDERQFCGVGSVKSNIGHLLSASGIASLIKVLLSLAHRELPPTLHCEQPNPRFQFGESPFYIVQQHQPWGNGANEILRAGISAFGLGGNNAHVLVSNEGIPAERRVELPLQYPDAPFQRKHCWPQSVQKASCMEEASILSPSSSLQQRSEPSNFFDFIKL